MKVTCFQLCSLLVPKDPGLFKVRDRYSFPLAGTGSTYYFKHARPMRWGRRSAASANGQTTDPFELLKWHLKYVYPCCSTPFMKSTYNY